MDREEKKAQKHPVCNYDFDFCFYFEFKALFAEIEANQANLDQCQKLSQQYSAAVKVTYFF